MRAFVHLFLFLVVFSMASPGFAQQAGGDPPPIPAEARTALVIGVSSYADRYFNKLESPEADAKAVAEKLTALGFQVTLRLNTTRKEMLEVTDALGDTLAKNQGVGLFYFSGHGSIKEDEPDPNFLIPAGSNISSREDLPQEAFNAQRVANRMKEAGNRLNLVFLDACRNNALPSRTKDAAGGLAAMRGASGLMFFFATQPNQVALEGKVSKRSLFTHALLKHIETPGLSFMDMMADVTAETERLSLADGGGFKQSPYVSGTLSGRFAFVPGDGLANLVSPFPSGNGASPAIPSSHRLPTRPDQLGVPRIWTDSQGRTMEAAFTKLEGDQVSFLLGNTKQSVFLPLSRLSIEDQTLVRALAAKSASSTEPPNAAVEGNNVIDTQNRAFRGIKLGTSTSTVLEHLYKDELERKEAERMLADSGTPYGSDLEMPGAPGLFLYFSRSEKKLMHFSVRSGDYKTTEGVGIGSPIKEFTRAYGPVRTTYPQSGGKAIRNYTTSRSATRIMLYTIEKLELTSKKRNGDLGKDDSIPADSFVVQWQNTTDPESKNMNQPPR